MDTAAAKQTLADIEARHADIIKLDTALLMAKSVP